MPEDCLEELQCLLKNGAKVTIVYYGIDDFDYTANWQATVDTIFRVPYTDNYRDKFQYYVRLLENLGTIKQKFNEMVSDKKTEGVTLLQENGVYIAPIYVENNIEKSPQAYVNLKKFQRTNINDGGEGEKRFQQCIHTLWQIKQLCDANGIQFIPFFNPQHMTTYLADDMELMNRFKKELVKISPFWDFSGVNYVTANNYFWYETSHPRAFICDKILDTVSGQNQITWVPDFGVYVTPENVDAFCEKAVRDRAAYDPNHEQWIPSPEERKIMTKRVNY